MRRREVCLWVGQGTVGHQGGWLCGHSRWVIRLVFAPLPTPDVQCEKASIPIAVGAQSLSCLIYVATVETLARGVPMAFGDWMSEGS